MASLVTPSLSGPSSRGAAALWARIEELTTEALVLRKEGDEAGAARLLGQELPPMLGQWAGMCGLPAPARKLKLQQMLEARQQQVEEMFLQRRLIVDEVVRRLREPVAAPAALPAPSVSASPTRATPSFGLRRRIPFGDVSDMLDAVNDLISEQERERILPVRNLAALCA